MLLPSEGKLAFQLDPTKLSELDLVRLRRETEEGGRGGQRERGMCVESVVSLRERELQLLTHSLEDSSFFSIFHPSPYLPLPLIADS